MRTASFRLAGLAVALATCATTGLAQTAIKLPKNKFTPEQDVQMGLEAATEVRKQYPVITDERITGYLTTLGDRLVAAAPQELKQPVYKYSFTPVNLKEINAFALPGGPMFVHRGMFDAAATEGEVAGVMAHELSHVLLRHGTANATKAQNPWLQLGQIAGAVGGAVVGGGAGSLIAQSSQFGLGTLLLRYSRDFEKQADLLGAQIMARAGYNPRDLGRMFETIERESKSSGSSGPQWMSSHPDPGNRTQYINKEADALTVGPAPDTAQFEQVKAAFAALPPAKTSAELARRGGGGDQPEPDQSMKAVGTPGQPVPRPSTQYRPINGGKVFQASVPENWTSLNGKTTIRVVPENGYGPIKGQTVFTHGVEFGLARTDTRDLQQATKAWLSAVTRGNPDLRLAGSQETTQISQRSALVTPLINPSPLGGQEHIVIYTTFLAEGSLFYYLTLAPEADFAQFQDVFQRIGSSIRLTDVR